MAFVTLIIFGFSLTARPVIEAFSGCCSDDPDNKFPRGFAVIYSLKNQKVWNFNLKPISEVIQSFHIYSIEILNRVGMFTQPGNNVAFFAFAVYGIFCGIFFSILKSLLTVISSVWISHNVLEYISINFIVKIPKLPSLFLWIKEWQLNLVFSMLMMTLLLLINTWLVGLTSSFRACPGLIFELKSYFWSWGVFKVDPGRCLCNLRSGFNLNIGLTFIARIENAIIIIFS